jgi:site-specific DNA recombinase
LTNVLYRGDISHKGTVYPGEHEAIVSRELWVEVNGKLRLSRTISRSHVKVETLLENLLACGQCGSLLRTSFTRRQGQRHVYYVCRAGKKRNPACPQGPVTCLDLDRSLRERLERMRGALPDAVAIQQLLQCVSCSSLDLI